MTPQEELRALRVYRFVEWGMTDPKWLRRRKAEIINRFLYAVYAPSIRHELTRSTALYRMISAR